MTFISTLRIAVAAGAALAALAVASAAPAPGFVTRTTDKGCIVYDREGAEPAGFEGMNAALAEATWTWNGSCEKGMPISGNGTLAYDVQPGSTFYGGSGVGSLVHGYKDGSWSNSSKVDHDGTTMSLGTATYRMGCYVDEGTSSLGDCTPATVEDAAAEPQAEPVAEPTPTAEDENEDAFEEAADGGDEDPGVNETSEGDVPTNRWVEARRTKDPAPKHIPGHDVSQCVGTFWKMHAGTGHYVLYNKCDKPIRVGWCSIGYGGDCIAGKGQIATMEPMMGYASGLKREETPKYSACSKNIFPVYEGNELVAFSCD